MFKQSEYDRCDWEGKLRWLKWLDSNGYHSVHVDLKYGVDIVASKGKSETPFEIEVKSNYPWTSKEDYPFKTVHFLGRKKKYGHFFYVILCWETDAYVMCHSSKIFKPENKIFKRAGRGSEVFYEVRKDDCDFGKIP